MQLSIIRWFLITGHLSGVWFNNLLMLCITHFHIKFCSQPPSLSWLSGCDWIFSLHQFLFLIFSTRHTFYQLYIFSALNFKTWILFHVMLWLDGGKITLWAFICSLSPQAKVTSHKSSWTFFPIITSGQDRYIAHCTVFNYIWFEPGQTNYLQI